MQNGHELGDSTILVVEDNRDVLEATNYLIEAAFGCKVLPASSYAEALALIEKGNKVDLIFCDVVLADGDGLTLARAARERLPDIPFVLVTGWLNEIDSVIERGYVALLKPYTVEQLEAVLIEPICRRQVAPPRASSERSDRVTGVST